MALELLLYFFIGATATLTHSNGFSPTSNCSKSHRDRPIWCGSNPFSCGRYLKGALCCGEDTIEMIRCNCMFYNEVSRKTEFGTCPYTCFNPQPTSYFKVNRYSITNYTLFNKRMCNYYKDNATTVVSNRTGRFCGQCLSGHGFAVYSYHLSSCIPCHYSRMNWVKYFSIALLPLTGFYCLVAMLGINLAAGKMNGLIFSVQIVMAPLNLILMDAWYHAESIQASVVFKFIIALFGLVNLDFFRDVYPKFCISPHFNVVHVLALDYLVALYPFLLIMLTYVLIKMYDKGFILVVWAWKPFSYLLQGRQFNQRTTLVETFSTFILLSSIKILSISFLLLTKTNGHDETGAKLSKNYLYLDASIKLFSAKHRHFGVLAIIIAFTFFFLPLFLLLVYPCKFFQKLLNFFGGQFQALHVFMDAFQGSYRTDPVDLRYFSAYYMVIRLIHQYIMSYFQSISVMAIITVLLMITTIIFVLIKPYKDRLHNQIDLISLLFLTLFYASNTLTLTTYYLDITWIKVADAAFFTSLMCIVLFYIIMFSYFLCGHSLKHMFKACSKKKKEEEDNVVEERLEVNDESQESRALLSVSSKYTQYY